MSSFNNSNNQEKPKKVLNFEQKGPAKLKPKYGVIKNVIGVISGKGGVGLNYRYRITSKYIKKKGI